MAFVIGTRPPACGQAARDLRIKPCDLHPLRSFESFRDLAIMIMDYRKSFVTNDILFGHCVILW